MSAVARATGRWRASARRRDVSATCRKLTNSNATAIAALAATSMRNDTSRCFQKLRCFSTPQASFTALVTAPKKPSDAHTSAESSRQADPQALGSKGIELIGQEIESRREIAEHEPQDPRPVGLIGRDDTEDRDDEQEKRKERQQRVVGDRCGVREVVPADQPDECPPRRLSPQAQLAAHRPPQPAPRRSQRRAAARREARLSRISCFFILL